jgi:replication factor A1
MVLLKRLPIEMLRYGRGRPCGQQQSVAEMSNRGYLIWISQKYGLDTRAFLACFLDAWIHERSSFRGISIQCRQKTENGGVFLVMQDRKIIAQLSIDEIALKRLLDVDLKSFPWNESTLTEMVGDFKIKDVNSRVKHVNLKARVVEKSMIRLVHTRFGGTCYLSVATISDNTGSIKLPLWNDQIDAVSVGDSIHIENGRVKKFKGELQVRIGKKGKLIADQYKSIDLDSSTCSSETS